MSDADEKLQARGGDMGDDTDAFLAWLDSLPKEPNDTVKAAYAAYKAAVRPAAHDLMAELVEAAEGIAPLVDCDEPREPDGDSIGWQNGNEPIPVTFGQVRAFFAALAKIKEQQT